MNYNKMFDLLFSEVITEDVKLAVAEKVRGAINEGVVESSPLTALLSTLVYEEEVTEEVLNDIIDIVFEGVPEDEIERVIEEFKRDTVIDIMEWDPAPVGLTGVRKADSQPTKPTAKDKLKSAVGKVKNWAGNVAKKAAAGIKAGVEKTKQAVNQPTGLDKLKQMRSEAIKHAVEMGTVPKAEKAKDEAEAVSKAETEAPEPEKHEEVKGLKHIRKAQQQVEASKLKPITATSKTGKVTRSISKKTSKKAVTVAKSAGKKVAKVIKDAETPKEKVTIRKGGKKVNEALEEVITLLTTTNISEDSLVQIVEMISNKRAAKKAVERDYENFKKAADALNKAEENACKIGVPADPDVLSKLSKEAQEKGEHYERFKSLSDKKFGEDCN